MTQTTPQYYVAYLHADHRYRMNGQGNWVKSENPMSRWQTTDLHDWDYVESEDVPQAVIDQHTAHLERATADGINLAIGVSK